MNHRLIELLAPPSQSEWVSLVFIFIGLIVCISISEFLRRRYHRSAEVTRKFVHVTVGLVIFFTPNLFQSALIPLLLAALSLIAMAVAVQTGLLIGIHGTSRYSYGTVFYPLSFLVLILLFWKDRPEIISLSMLCLALGDASAAVVGESFHGVKEYHLTSDKKSIEGSITMFLVSSMSLYGGMFLLDLSSTHSIAALILIALVAASIATAWEALSSRGFDNITVPLSVALVLSIYLFPSPMRDSHQFTLGVFLSFLIAVFSYYFRFLSASGSVATFLLASTIYGLGGWQWTVPILTFFILSSLLSKAGKRSKERFELLFEKTSIRDWGQVAANGGIAGIFMIGQYVFPNFNLYPAYLGSVAAVAADTWGTEIGIWIHGKTISLSRFTLVEPGTNGGVSLAGFVGGAIGALTVSASAFFWTPAECIVFFAALSGIIGSLLDSLLGGTLQAAYQCSTCNAYTERKIHCGSPTVFVKGIRWMTNDVVNWFCAITGGAIAMGLAYLN